MVVQVFQQKARWTVLRHLVILTSEILQRLDACHSLRDTVPGHCPPAGHGILRAIPFTVAGLTGLDATARHTSRLSSQPP